MGYFYCFAGFVLKSFLTNVRFIIKFLTFKTVFLLALATACRVSAYRRSVVLKEIFILGKIRSISHLSQNFVIRTKLQTIHLTQLQLKVSHLFLIRMIKIDHFALYVHWSFIFKELAAKGNLGDDYLSLLMIITREIFRRRLFQTG